MTRQWTAMLTVAVTAMAAPSAQQQGGSDQRAEFEAATTAVVVDVVARDRKGPVTDLTADDFEIFEDGKSQQIVTFERRVPSKVTEVSSAEVAPPAPGVSPARPNVIALAWGQLSPEGRALARQAADTLVKDREADELVGVFVVDQALQTLTPYTTNVEELKAAVERASLTATTRTGREANLSLDSRIARPSTSPTASADQAGRPAPSADPATIGASFADSGATVSALREAATREALQRMEESYEQLLSDVQGRSSMDALLALVDSLGEIPGRKTVVYLCEGLTVAPAVESRFRSIVETANRKNVSIYALDAAGLRVHSKQAETGREVEQLAASTLTGIDRDNSKKWTEDLERNEQVLKLDPSASLGILTGETGGLLIQNTNDLERGIGRINDDRRYHYLLTYSPTNSALDGTYRKIEVKVNRSGVEVHARRGYLAVPPVEAGPVLTYEASALAALAASPLPTAVPLRTRR